jgi:hypothetical protein
VTAIAAIDVSGLKGFRFSGHETFACRYAWLPKAYRMLKANPRAFSNEDQAMVDLGIGKNMVRALRFWVEVMDVAAADRKTRSLHLTEFGHGVFGDTGFDPYLEDPRTLWLLHWNLASRQDGALFAWRFMIGHWPYPEFTRSQALAEFRRLSDREGLEHSEVTLSQHLDVFLHTYQSTRGGAAAVEDSLDGPLVELDLITPVGERRGDGGRWETVYGFRREPKTDIGQALFDHCLHAFWRQVAPNDGTLSFRSVALAPGSPGQVFKLSEDDLRDRLEAAAVGEAPRGFTYQPSAIQGLLTRAGDGPTLADVYAEEPQDV